MEGGGGGEMDPDRLLGHIVWVPACARSMLIPLGAF